MTLLELKDAAAAAPGVIAAEVTLGPQPASGFRNLHGAVISVVVDAGSNVFRRTNHDVLITGSGTPEEVAGWVNGLSPVLQPESTLLNGKVTPEQVESYCNTQWKAAVPGASDIMDFHVGPLGTKGVVVSGLFHTAPGASAKWVRKSFAIHLIDPNGQPTGANIKFIEIT